MKKHLFSLFTALLLVGSLSAQVTTVPAFVPIGYTGEVTVVFNPAEGNGGMKGAKECWAHTGVIVGGKTWQHVPGSWRSYPDKCRLTKKSDGTFELKLSPDINTWYGCQASEQVTGLCFVFNDGKDGSMEGKAADGSDIFVYFVEPGLRAQIQSPASDVLVEEGETVNFRMAASEEAELTLAIDGKTVLSRKSTEAEYAAVFDKQGTYEAVFTAKTADDTKTDRRLITVMGKTVEAPRPEGIDMGIYYDEADDTRLTLCTFAASKTEPAKAVFVLGDMNGWKTDPVWQMKRDGDYFWLEVENLVPGREYAFQYLVIRADGKQVRISDLYSTKLLHKDDQYEPRQTDPSLMAYPVGADGGYATVVQTAKPQYFWSDATLQFRRPDKNNLIIYELWVYDFSPLRNISGVMRRLDYLHNLGVNAIELMPVCEFDGNYNWGYSPNHYFAPDKAYGSETQIKQFIDACHQRGIAVILDMVFNHATGLNPMNKIYPYGTDLQYNPWFCTQVPHNDNVYEHWNHDFLPARNMFTRALNYWLQEYHVDGYRMDLSHGLCGCGTPAAYDQQKLMNNLFHYYHEGVLAAADTAVHGEPYFILEHWGNNMGSQRPKLVAEGMLCWENTNNAYSQTAMGWLKDGDGFVAANKDGYVSYCESHDEERNFYKAREWGNGFVKENEAFRLNRVPVNMAFNLLLNGPHMIWQFQELGYDYSINSTKGSSAISEGNRTSTKEQPDSHGWYQAGLRMQQYQRVAQLVQLRTRLVPEVFAGNPVKTDIGSGKAVRHILWGEGEKAILVVGNFSANEIKTVFLPEGRWFDWYGQRWMNSSEVLLAPGALFIFTAKEYPLPQVPEAYDFTTPVEVVLPTAGGVQWNVWPLVTTGKVFFSDAVDAQLFSLSGQPLQQWTNVSSADLAPFAAGLYLLRLRRGAACQTVKIIRQ
ncbi:MAG: hypothetical protein IJ169_03320 [Paludibacteraceae bacterium]|nr:hypothetical protein [Paludibacteraceae bacterium]